MSFEELCAEAGVVFAGTVTRASASKVPGGPIVTEYAFGDLQVAKGSPSGGQAVLTIMGGTLGGLHSRVVGLPELRVGARYIVFSDGDFGSVANAYLPVIGLQQGVFLVAPSDSVDGCVIDGFGRNVIAIQDGRIVVEVMVRPGGVSVKTTDGSFRYRDTEPTAWTAEDSLVRSRVAETIRQQRARLEAARARRRALARSSNSDTLSNVPESRVGAKSPAVLIAGNATGRSHCMTEDEFLEHAKRGCK
jgi:hypothetical protein